MLRIRKLDATVDTTQLLEVKLAFKHPDERFTEPAKYRDWLSECLSTGVVYEGEATWESYVYDNPAASSGKSRRFFNFMSYYFTDAESALVFKLAFIDQVFQEPDPSIYEKFSTYARKTKWGA